MSWHSESVHEASFEKLRILFILKEGGMVNKPRPPVLIYQVDLWSVLAWVEMAKRPCL